MGTLPTKEVQALLKDRTPLMHTGRVVARIYPRPTAGRLCNVYVCIHGFWIWIPYMDLWTSCAHMDLWMPRVGSAMCMYAYMAIGYGYRTWIYGQAAHTWIPYAVHVCICMRARQMPMASAPAVVYGSWRPSALCFIGLLGSLCLGLFGKVVNNGSRHPSTLPLLVGAVCFIGSLGSLC